jgi:hypothetical protein
MRVIAEETGADVHLLAVQAKCTELGETMCDEVQAAVGRLVDELQCLLHSRGQGPLDAEGDPPGPSR